MKIQRVGAALLLSFLAGCVPPQIPPFHPIPPSGFNIAAVVADPNGQAIEGATCATAQQSAETNGDGYHLFLNVAPGGQLMTCIKAGYSGPSVPYQSDGDKNIQNTLERTLPAPPSRDELLSASENMQGLTLTCADYPNGFPYYEAPFSSLSAACRQALYTAKRAAGSRMIGIALSWNYCGQAYGFCYPVPGRDLAYDLSTLRGLMLEAIEAGFYIDLKLAGDGMSSSPNPGPGDYNDPVGWTYGYEWLMANTSRIVLALQGGAGVPDLTPYTVLVPGYDGIVPGWPEPTYTYPGKADNWLLLARSVCSSCYIGIELSAGYAHWGGEGGNFSTPAGLALDQIQQEFNLGPYESSNMDQVWQIGARHLGPEYVRGPGQPASDDPGAPFGASSPQFYLRNGTPRGAIYVKAFEPDTYLWVRDRISVGQVQSDRAYLRARGYKVVD